MSNIRYTSRPSEASNEDALAQLALDVKWTRSVDAYALWRQLNPALWEQTKSPWAVLQTVSGKNLERIASQPEFTAKLAEVTHARAAANEAPRWFGKSHPNSPLTCVAYFSMEYMLSEALPIYSGGLGNVAGDQLKAADDLGVPVVAVGLLYAQGYFRQELDRNGGQRALYPFNDPGQLPVKPLRDVDGDWLRLVIPFPGSDLWVRAWEVQVGRTKLYLLDTNDPANIPEFRGITNELYGGGADLRLRQEHVLGIGGWQLLRSLGIQPQVCHLNEGHAAFAVLERAAAWMEKSGRPFHEALTATRPGNLFTTHTPVEAGFDRFSTELMRSHFDRYCARRLGIDFEELMALGRRNPSDESEPFNMAYLAIRSSGAINGVSRLHGEVSRNLFQSLFPRWPSEDVPVSHVTNGIHVPTWRSAEAHELWNNVCGERCWEGALGQIDAKLRGISDAAIWRMRTEARTSLIEFIRARYARQIAIQGGSPAEVSDAASVFEPGTLTLGFARRFATYKRPNLLLHDQNRLLRILRDARRPVQLVIAGKAHPQDGAGQDMIREWSDFVRRSGVGSSVVFLSDYDMLMTVNLVGGVDLWINTPRRPWEASGTSGMKVLANGGLNLSETDGWWEEAYSPEVGWAIGDGREHGDDPAWDAAEAESMYALLEQQVVPDFYERNDAGIPVKWIARVRESMARLTTQYSAHRTVREYTESLYIPAAAAHVERADKNGRLAGEVLSWQKKLEAGWGSISFGSLTVTNENDTMRFEVEVHLGQIDPCAVQVELLADAGNGYEPVRKTMERGAPVSPNTLRYSVAVAGHRPATDFTPRVVPWHPKASVPLEAGQILWQK